MSVTVLYVQVQEDMAALASLLLVIISVTLSVRGQPPDPVDPYLQGKVQALLERYGYLPGPRPGVGSLRVLVPPTELEAAIKDFQHMANVTQTGRLDNATLDAMRWTRCGNADKVREPEPETGAAQGEARRRKRYVLEGNKWSDEILTYKILNQTPDLPTTSQEHAIKRAFDAWQAESNIQFVRLSASRVNIDIKFTRGNHGDVFPFEGPGGSLAHAFYPPYGDIHLDEDERFTLMDRTGKDLYQILVHEIGHSLGLRHSHDPASVMWPYMGDYTPYWGLSSDDREGIVALYGEKGAHNPSVRTTPSPTTTTTTRHQAYPTDSYEGVRRNPGQTKPPLVPPYPTQTYPNTPGLAPNPTFPVVQGKPGVTQQGIQDPSGGVPQNPVLGTRPVKNPPVTGWGGVYPTVPPNTPPPHPTTWQPWTNGLTPLPSRPPGVTTAWSKNPPVTRWTPPPYPGHSTVGVGVSKNPPVTRWIPPESTSGLVPPSSNPGWAPTVDPNHRAPSTAFYPSKNPPATGTRVPRRTKYTVLLTTTQQQYRPTKGNYPQLLTPAPNNHPVSRTTTQSKYPMYPVTVSTTTLSKYPVYPIPTKYNSAIPTKAQLQDVPGPQTRTPGPTLTQLLTRVKEAPREWAGMAPTTLPPSWVTPTRTRARTTTARRSWWGIG